MEDVAERERQAGEEKVKKKRKEKLKEKGDGKSMQEKYAMKW